MPNWPNVPGMPKLPEIADSARVMPGDAAKMLGVTTKTLSRMPGLTPIVLPSGHRRYRLSEIEALMGAGAA